MARWKRKGKKRRSNPKNTKAYKVGMRNNLLMGSAIGLVGMAVFYKTAIMQTIVANTPTFGEEI
jgi:hypothetical protein